MGVTPTSPYAVTPIQTVLQEQALIARNVVSSTRWKESPLPKSIRRDFGAGKRQWLLRSGLASLLFAAWAGSFAAPLHTAFQQTAPPQVTDQELKNEYTVEELRVKLKPHFNALIEEFERSQDPVERNWAPLLETLSTRFMLTVDQPLSMPIEVKMKMKPDGTFALDGNGQPVFDLRLNGVFFGELLRLIDRLPPADKEKAETILRSYIIKELGGIEAMRAYPESGAVANVLDRYFRNALHLYRDPSNSSGFDLDRALSDPDVVALVQLLVVQLGTLEGSGYVRHVRYLKAHGVDLKTFEALRAESKKLNMPLAIKGIESASKVFEVVSTLGSPLRAAVIYHAAAVYAKGATTPEDALFCLAYYLDLKNGTNPKDFLKFIDDSKSAHPTLKELKERFKKFDHDPQANTSRQLQSLNPHDPSLWVLGMAVPPGRRPKKRRDQKAAVRPAVPAIPSDVAEKIHMHMPEIADTIQWMWEQFQPCAHSIYFSYTHYSYEVGFLLGPDLPGDSRKPFQRDGNITVEKMRANRAYAGMYRLYSDIGAQKGDSHNIQGSDALLERARTLVERVKTSQSWNWFVSAASTHDLSDWIAPADLALESDPPQYPWKQRTFSKLRQKGVWFHSQMQGFTYEEIQKRFDLPRFVIDRLTLAGLPRAVSPARRKKKGANEDAPRRGSRAGLHQILGHPYDYYRMPMTLSNNESNLLDWMFAAQQRVASELHLSPETIIAPYGSLTYIPNHNGHLWSSITDIDVRVYFEQLDRSVDVETFAVEAALAKALHETAPAFGMETRLRNGTVFCKRSNGATEWLRLSILPCELDDLKSEIIFGGFDPVGHYYVTPGMARLLPPILESLDNQTHAWNIITNYGLLQNDLANHAVRMDPKAFHRLMFLAHWIENMSRAAGIPYQGPILRQIFEDKRKAHDDYRRYKNADEFLAGSGLPSAMDLKPGTQLYDGLLKLIEERRSQMLAALQHMASLSIRAAHEHELKKAA